MFGDSQFTSTLSVNFHFPKIPRRTKFDAKFDGLDKKFATKADLHEAQVKQQQWMFRTMLALISLGVGLTGAIVAALFKYMPQ